MTIMELSPSGVIIFPSKQAHKMNKYLSRGTARWAYSFRDKVSSGATFSDTSSLVGLVTGSIFSDMIICDSKNVRIIVTEVFNVKGRSHVTRNTFKFSRKSFAQMCEMVASIKSDDEGTSSDDDDDISF